MAGIYVHIPFCKQACHYCDFHFSTSSRLKGDFLQCLEKEIELQQNYLGGEVIKTVYFGGGTPSLLSADELNRIVDQVRKFHVIANDAEITLEANPDDLTTTYLRELRSSPINRLSIGIQSFRDKDLDFMNRAHTVQEAISAVKGSQDAGFENITIDLIYGIPGLTNEEWIANLQQAIALEVSHISAYCLTVETRTALHKWVETGKVTMPMQEQEADQFLILQRTLAEADLIQYEISNFGKEGHFSQHNSSYWKGEKYLGLGPSAHSFDRKSRQWNVSNNQRYVDAVTQCNVPFEREELHAKTAFNEYILTSLRTIWGANTAYVHEHFGEERLQTLMEQVETRATAGLMQVKGETISLTEDGKLLADRIASDLFA